SNNRRERGMGTTAAPPLAAGSRGQRFHAALYLGLQAARGRPVGACMRRLSEWEQLDRKAFRAFTARRLRDALRQAAADAPLYGKGAWRQAQRRPDDIRAWPVLERDVLRTQSRDLLA